ncbi:MAG: SusD/RagB family nutrient-binding outer membrane lipoprotein [Cyclobacteriaceae bacterium]
MSYRKRYIFGLITTTLLFFSGCEEGFDTLNTDKVNPTTLDPGIVMNKGILDVTYRDGFGTLQMLSYNFGIVQQIITPYGSSLAGANYNQINAANTSRVWENFYRNVIKQLVDVTYKTRDDAERSNLYNMARIWKVYSFMILTDTYGDIPYFEAGKGFLEDIVEAKYDPQQDIYLDILKELDEASAALDDSKPLETSDILYEGNVTNWKRLGYSLLLRAAMRLSKVDPATAQTYVTKAVDGGLMESNADNSVIRHTSLYNNYIGQHLSAREKTNYYLAAPFVNYLQETADPRLESIAIRYVGATGGPEQTMDRASTEAEVQVGMPMGYDDVSISTVLEENGVASLWDFSQGNINTVLKVNAPEFHVTYAQTQLLLSEAAVRGWTSGDAATLFSTGIRAHMEQMAIYDVNATIEESTIQAYLDTHSLDMARALEQINTQYWVASFLDGTEAWANFRRSEFPALSSNPYPGSEITEDFIRRMPYPDSEIITNQQNVTDAISRQGPDNLDTRIWWDKAM